MTTKNLIVLGGAAVVLAGAAWYCNAGRRIKTPALAGKPVLASFDVSAAARVEIGGEKPLKIAATDGGWKVESLHGYPADVTKIRENLLKLTELKVGQVARGRKIEKPALVDVQDVQGKSLAALPLGDKHTSKPRGQAAMFGGGGYPDGRYVQVGDVVALVSDTLDAFDGDPKKWVDPRIADVSSSDVVGVTFQKGKDKLVLTKKDGAWSTPGIGPKEEFDSSNSYSLESALSHLDFADVASPKKTEAELGFPTGAVCTVALKDGTSYVARLGDATDKGRYFKIAASFTATGTNATANAACEKAVKDFNAKAGKWTYVVASYEAGRLDKTRKDFVKEKKEEPKKEDAKKEEPKK